MGFVALSTFVPERRKNEFSLFITKLKAEHMMDIVLELPTDDPARVALAQCNYVAVPTVAEVNGLLQNTALANVRRLCRECLSHLEQFNSARNALKIIETADDEVINLASLAVAHNAMADWLWQEAQQISLPSEGEITTGVKHG